MRTTTKSKAKEPEYPMCHTCRNDRKPVYKLHTSGKVFCSLKCIESYFNGVLMSYDGFKIKT